MWKEAAKIGVPAPLPGPPPLESDEIDSLASEVVVRAYRRFERHGLNTWSPIEGMSLHGWFVNDCKYQFANAVRAWSKDRGTLTPGQDCSLGVDDMDLDSIHLRPAFGYDNPITPETAVVESMELDRRLGQIESNLGSRARWIFEQHSLHKRSFAEISRESKMSVYMVKKLFKKGQEILRRLWEEE
jgi:DNA-directed RNA polymerase specialized sigma24 family protein